MSATALAASAVARAELGDDTFQSAGAGEVSFVNDVLPVLSKAGCNQGTCHGGAAGKGGFRLSLRGFAPEQDYVALVREEFGRRLNFADPRRSLILLKPTLGILHQGGRLIDRKSASYELLLRWIRAGAPGPKEDEPRITDLAIEPTNVVLERNGTVLPKVQARFSNGLSRDVTPWIRWDSSNAAVARINPAGLIAAADPGRAAATAAYQSLVAAVEITVPFPTSDAVGDYGSLPRANYIDDLVIEAWQALRLWPSPPIDDAAIYRRLAVDITGTLPSPAEVRAYVADPSGDKRVRAIDNLLGRSGFVDCWAQKWEDIFRASREWIGEKSVWAFDRYLRDCIQRDVPWDTVVRELISSSGNSGQSGPANFFRLQKVFNELELWPLTAAETAAQTFLGLRLQCARCHNHPFDRWTQADYYGMVSFFARTGVKPDDDGNIVVFERATGEISHPRLGRPIAPTPPGGTPMPSESVESRRRFLAAWATSPENPYFARATANRIWRHFMGRGLVEPVDDLRASNPASNPRLLVALADDLKDHKFDVKWLIRQIVSSQAYAISSAPTPENAADTQFYSHWQPKRLTAEQLLDALASVTELPEKFAGLPAGFRAQQLPDTKVPSAFLDMFGRPLRRSACECERIQEPNLAQSLELMHSDAVDARVRSDAGLVARRIAAGANNEDLMDEIYWRALARAPSEVERQVLATELAAAVDGLDGREPQLSARRRCFEDILWAVLNSKEFLFNH